MDNNDNNTAKPKRTKTNYNLVEGSLFLHIKANPGATIPQLHEKFGASDANQDGHKTPVIYQAVRNLKKKGVIFGTGAKKNEGLYLTKEDAEKNKPAPTVRPDRKKDKPFTLEKKMPKGNWWAIEGNPDKQPILDAYELATAVPGDTFRAMDNTDADKGPQVMKSNEVTTPAPANAKNAKTAKQPAKA